MLTGPTLDSSEESRADLLQPAEIQPVALLVATSFHTPPMPHYCRLCDSYRSNEAFSGKGRRLNLCSECRRLPPQVRADRLAILEIHGFVWRQSHISAKNMIRLRALTQSINAEVAELAAVVMQVGAVAPGRRRRFARIRNEHPMLGERMRALGLVPDDDDHTEDFLSASAGNADPDAELAFDHEDPAGYADCDIPF